MKGRLNTNFGVISKEFRERSVCISVHLSLSCKKHGLKNICDLFEIKHTEFIYSCIIDVQYNIVSDTVFSFFTSNLIRVEFKFNY